jgi:hypothetical protein
MTIWYWNSILLLKFSFLNNVIIMKTDVLLHQTYVTLSCVALLILCSPLTLSCVALWVSSSQRYLSYLAVQSSDYEQTWLRFQEHIVYTKLDIYICIWFVGIYHLTVFREELKIGSTIGSSPRLIWIINEIVMMVRM